MIPADLTPVRGIPRKEGQEDGDSTDLDDEDDGDRRKASRKREKMQVPLVPSSTDVEKAMAAAQRNLGITVSTPHESKESKEGSALARGSMRTKAEDEQYESAAQAPDVKFAAPEKKKRGFSFLRRNRNSSSSVQQVVPSSPAAVPASPAVATPASQTVTKQEPPSTPASPSAGKLIRRTSHEPKTLLNAAAATTSPDTSIGTSTTVGKEGDDWPLPSPKPATDGITQDPLDSSRPQTSDGFSPEAIKLAQTMRPDLGRRSQSGQQMGHRVRIQAGEEGSEPGERDPKAVYSRRTGKKKKFGMLRRALGIDD